ncbi:MAG TPA: bifunctional glutamate N-acetyltransferase/amino-acid acetyltransferase ArgJ [bacterium]|nr:bifunctional glutamate N-acetyltransferase/amino-acid acetyltransferase ArgJ [bacterium]HOL46663.1 bifunctional glutamate N-acetyltransferase/amino-acid acetyltransferase ArgJ [bacterium]HPQ18351.1 bifunctional glutamate N-acetyltransferase/amino-acid acetyltransferase ArgJ [bacterium]
MTKEKKIDLNLLRLRHINGGITAPLGFMASGIHCGIKISGLDLALIYSNTPAIAAAMFTTNKIKAAPIIVSQKHIKKGDIRAIIINSGNANACTGKKGLKDAEKMCEATANLLKIKKEQVLVASTGVIGVPLPIDKIIQGIEKFETRLSSTGSQLAANAIMTTDQKIKETSVIMRLGAKSVKIGGIAKGSGMINPNMATMLAFLTTDVNISLPMLKSALKESVDETFNKITIDGDRSTNDMVAIIASKKAQNYIIDKKNNDYEMFVYALKKVCKDLAYMIVADGEGVKKVIKIEVENGKTDKECELVARTIANSLLVKTAIAGADPNWGRILAAIGYSGAKFEPKKLQINIQGILVYNNEEPTNYEEPKLIEALQKDYIKIKINLGLKNNTSAVILTSDLTEDYVKINSRYRT